MLAAGQLKPVTIEALLARSGLEAGIEALLRGWAEGLVGYSLRHGYDRQRGGFFYTGPLGQDADDTRKEWWVQAEALVSMLEMYRLTGKLDYYDTFRQTLDFVEQHQVAREGSWWATRKADGSPQGNVRSSPWPWSTAVGACTTSDRSTSCRMSWPTSARRRAVACDATIPMVAPSRRWIRRQQPATAQMPATTPAHGSTPARLAPGARDRSS